MINQNVSDANSNFDKTVYEFEAFARVEVTPTYSVVLNPLNHDVIQVGGELKLPKGKHLVRLVVTAEVSSPHTRGGEPHSCGTIQVM